MSTGQPVELPVNADALASVYVDNIPVLNKESSSREWYQLLKSGLISQPSVSHFNRVRFYARFRQMEVEDENEYALCYAEMDKFNRLSEQLFQRRVLLQENGLRTP